MEINLLVEKTKKLVKEFENVYNEEGVITGGFSVGNNIEKEFRRFSNDIDIVFKSEEDLPTREVKGPLTYLNITYYLKKVEEKLYLFFIIDERLSPEKYSLTKIKTFNEFFEKDGSYIEGKVFYPEEIFSRKIDICGEKRGYENVKDMYDISHLSKKIGGQEIEKVLENKNKSTLKKLSSLTIAFKLFEKEFRNKITPYIASRVFPEKEINEGINILKKYLPEEGDPKYTIFFSLIFGLSRRQVEKISKKWVGKETDKIGEISKVIWKKICEKEGEVERLYEKLYNKKDLLGIVEELFTS